MAGTGRLPTARSSRDLEGSGEGRDHSDGGCRGVAAIRYLRHNGLNGGSRYGGRAGHNDKTWPDRRETPLSSAFILATGALATDASFTDASAVASGCEPILGFRPRIAVASVDSIPAPDGDLDELFVLPVSLDFHLLEREALGRAIADLRRSNPKLVVHHDD